MGVPSSSGLGLVFAQLRIGAAHLPLCRISSILFLSQPQGRFLVFRVLSTTAVTVAQASSWSVWNSSKCLVLAPLFILLSHQDSISWFSRDLLPQVAPLLMHSTFPSVPKVTSVSHLR